jgi:hypothetical protein
MTEHDAEYERILREIRYERQMRRKRMYEQVARVRRAESSQKDNPHVRAEKKSFEPKEQAKTPKSACSCGCKGTTK